MVPIDIQILDSHLQHCHSWHLSINDLVVQSLQAKSSHQKKQSFWLGASSYTCHEYWFGHSLAIPGPDDLRNVGRFPLCGIRLEEWKSITGRGSKSKEGIGTPRTFHCKLLWISPNASLANLIPHLFHLLILFWWFCSDENLWTSSTPALFG